MTPVAKKDEAIVKEIDKGLKQGLEEKEKVGEVTIPDPVPSKYDRSGRVISGPDQADKAAKSEKK